MNLSAPSFYLMRRKLAEILLPHGKMMFIDSVPKNCRLLDVGCGNNSPMIIKSRRPDIHYCGLDIGDYNQSSDINAYADEYVVTAPEQFSAEIAKHKAAFDVVISTHNLEHCNRPDEVLTAMLQAVKVGGMLYLSFPSEDSVNFPSRSGSLNFYDDQSHKNLLYYNDTLETIRAYGYSIEFSVKKYRPFILCCLGFILEPVARLLKRNMPYNSTWAYYGFETVIWAKRLN